MVVMGLTVSSLLAEVKIAQKNRVPNQQPGYCAWASLETICRHQKVKAGYDLVEKRKLDPDYVRWNGEIILKHFGTDEAIAAKLEKLGIKYKMNHTKDNTQEGVNLIKKSVKNNKPALIGVWHDPNFHQHHALTVVDMDEDNFVYIDPNLPQVEYEGTMKWFFQEWDGFVVVIEK